MQLPEVKHVSHNSRDKIIYFSADIDYYNKYGKCLLKSVISQIDWIGVHCHLILKDLKELDTVITHPRMSYSYEIIDNNFISSIPFTKSPYKLSKYSIDITPEITYYTCARFLQIDKVFPDASKGIFQIDCDSVLIRPFTQEMFKNLVAYPRFMDKPTQPWKVMAGTISFGSGQSGLDFRKLVANTLYIQFFKNAYWFIDQIILTQIKDSKPYEKIDLSWNTWFPHDTNMIFFTAKGRKKNYPIYTTQLEYWNKYEL